MINFFDLTKIKIENGPLIKVIKGLIFLDFIENSKYFKYFKS